MSKPAFLIAGTASGVGKTTVTCALIAAMRRRGLTVQPFKGGPDFLDTTHHTRLAGRPARNLDTWLFDPESNGQVFAQALQTADAAVVEGMMGLFDGKSGTESIGSSAEIARIFGLPVILVLDASKTARSIAATVLGFELYDPDLILAGVILNRVAGPRHLAMLEQAIRQRCRTPILGSLPRTPEIGIPERHLGLHAASTSKEPEQIATELCRLADLADAHFDMGAILSLAPASIPSILYPPLPTEHHPLRIGVARDEAFSFYYEDNLDLLRKQGATLVPFSPLADPHLPPDLDALYLGGGYPELHAEQLSLNHSLLAEIRAFAYRDRPIYAECGGMIYLAESLTPTSSATPIPLTGILPLQVEMTPKLVDFGYVTVTFNRDCLLGPAGTTVRGHSFHYSRLLGTPAVATAYTLAYSLSGRETAEGYTRANVLGSYVHLHFRANPTIIPHFVAAIRATQLAGAAL